MELIIIIMIFITTIILQVPDKECKVISVTKDNPVNTTECKTVQENKCTTVQLPVTVSRWRTLNLMMIIMMMMNRRRSAEHTTRTSAEMYRRR